MKWSRTGSIAAALALAASVPARADVFIAPSVGIASGGIVQDGSKITYGGQLGAISDGLFGIEGDYGYTAKIRGGNHRDNVRTLTGSLLIALSGNERFRAYASVGGGLIGAVTQVKHIFTVSSDEVESKGVVSAGGGFFSFFSDRIGIRVDARYFRILASPEEEGFDVSPQFIRAQGGVVFRF